MAVKIDSLKLYNKYYATRDFERLELFQKIAEKYHIKDVLYPGGFVHITPSFVFPHVVYVDSDKQAAKFFKNPAIYEFVANKKQYPEQGRIEYHQADYLKSFDEEEESFDLLISQYAGFVSDACKKYLRIGGVIVVNNSHLDASMASISDDFKLIAVYQLCKNKYSLSDKNLQEYLIPKREIDITRDLLLKKQRGIAYTKSASGYLFRRVKANT